jgi:hypothetical protein
MILKTRFFLTGDAPVASILEPYSTVWKADAMGPVYNAPFQLGSGKTLCRLIALLMHLHHHSLSACRA